MRSRGLRFYKFQDCWLTVGAGAPAGDRREATVRVIAYRDAPGLAAAFREALAGDASAAATDPWDADPDRCAQALGLPSPVAFIERARCFHVLDEDGLVLSEWFRGPDNAFFTPGAWSLRCGRDEVDRLADVLIEVTGVESGAGADARPPLPPFSPTGGIS